MWAAGPWSAHQIFTDPLLFLIAFSFTHPLRNWSTEALWNSGGKVDSRPLSGAMGSAPVEPGSPRPLFLTSRQASSLFLLEMFANLLSTDGLPVLFSVRGLFLHRHFCVSGGKTDLRQTCVHYAPLHLKSDTEFCSLVSLQKKRQLLTLFDELILCLTRFHHWRK